MRRTTRRLELTEEGSAYLEQARYLALDIEAVRAWAQQSTWPAALTQCLPSFA